MAEGESNGLLIREYGPRDIRALHKLDRICFPADIAYSRSEMLHCVNQKGSITRIAELNGRIVGFAVGCLVDPLAAHVLTLDVIHSARRLKVGTALMNTLHEEFRSKGAEISFLEVDVANDAARRFYEGLRYKCLEILPGYYNGRSDAYGMIRELAAV
jgi:ribosomal protein S18 acetylase RimI-like enzyme